MIFRYFSFFNDFIYLFSERERNGGRKRGRETLIGDWLPLIQPQLWTWSETRAGTLNRDRTCNLLTALNPLSHTSQG